MTPDFSLNRWSKEDWNAFKNAFDYLENTCRGKLVLEPLDVVVAVEDYRRVWRPKKTKVLLLAESHVFTQKNESVPLISYYTARPEYASEPNRFVRFVYCPAYGENEFVHNPYSESKNLGTPQFWKIFFSCCNQISSHGDFAPILKNGTSFEQRIFAKRGLLAEMKRRGIWLVDASIVGLYSPLLKKPARKVIEHVIQACWKLYIGKLVRDLAPEHIVVIGKGVSGILGDRLSPEEVGCQTTVIAQPQAHISSDEQLAQFRVINSICSRFAP